MRTEESIAVADLLAELRFNGNILDELPAELRPRDLSAAYSVQEALVERLQARYGGVRIGYKIACTNGSAQRLLNTNAPVFGCLVSSLVFESPANLNGDDFVVRGIEAEFAFEIVRDVPSPDLPHTAASIADYLGRVFPAIELVGHRFADWSRFDASILIADNAVHQAWIPGAGISDWRDLNLANHGVQVIVNGEPKLTGSGANVLGHPLKAMAWLANELPKWGRSLKAGELVTTGTCTDVYTAQPRDGIRVDFGVLGNVELSFVESSA